MNVKVVKAENEMWVHDVVTGKSGVVYYNSKGEISTMYDPHGLVNQYLQTKALEAQSRQASALENIAKKSKE